MSRLVNIFIVASLVLAEFAITPSPVIAATVLPAGFVSESVVTGLTGPTTIAFAPDGRIFIGQKDGHVRVFQNGVLLPADFIDLSAEVNTYWDRGLLGIAVHPDFPNTPYVYLLYVYDPPGTTADGNGARVSRLIRVTADPTNTNVALANSLVVLLGTQSTFAHIGDPNSNDGVPSCESGGVYVTDCIAADGPSHSVGTVAFGTDGSLFVSHGDGASFNYADVRALRALSVDSLNGKVLRINPITGQGYANNPFYDGNPDSNRSKVYDLGFRNPFRLTINTSTNEPFIGDVGWGTWEEADTGAGKNFGWPCYEGDNAGSAQQDSYKYNAATSAACATLYAKGLGAVQAPLYSYDHSQGDSAIIMGGFYQGTVYPSQYKGALFFSDYNADSIRYLTFDNNGNATANDFGTDVSPVGGVVQLLVGPDTNFYYVAYNGPTPNTSEVRRIRYTAGGNTPPTANASANPDSGLLPFTANFSSAGSFDPDLQTLTYLWDFGDGSPTSTDPNPSHQYTVAGKYTATLTVTDSQAATGSDTVIVSAGNLRPVAHIISPANGFAYNTGDTINYSGTGTDHEDGDLVGTNLKWNILLHHNQHIHFDFIPNLTDKTGSFSVPDHGDNTWIELCLTVTDSSGLTGQDCVNLQPNTVKLSFDTVPSGLELEYGGGAYITPFDITTNANSKRDLIAPLTQTCNTFASWSDGGAATHQINTGASPQTFTATYTPCPTSTVTASSGSGGAITPSGAVVISNGTNQTFDSAPNTTFILSDVLVDGASVGKANSYTFNNIAANHAISASFDGGWSAPTASTAVSGVNNPNNAFTSNNTNAVFNGLGNNVTYTTFGIPAIPVGAMINGIKVALEGYNSQGSPGRNLQLELSWDGGVNFTTITAARTTNLPITEGTVILGGLGDTWGRTWTSTEFTNANFVVRATSNGGPYPPVTLDQLQVKVSYIVPSIPPKVTLRSPRTNTITNNTLPTFWWSNVTDGQSYEIMFAANSAFTSSPVSKTVSGSPYTVISPFSDGTYYWRVRAVNAASQSGPWSSARTFTIDATGPAIPTLISPIDDAPTRTPTFKWSLVPTAVSYQFQYDDAADFLTPLYTVTLRGNFRRPPAMPNGIYYWRVSAKDAAGNWSGWTVVPYTVHITGP